MGLLAPGLLSDNGGLEMEEEERGCVRVRLVSGWRGALGTGGEEHRLHTAGRRGGGDPAASGGGAVAAVASLDIATVWHSVQALLPLEQCSLRYRSKTQ